VEFVVLGSQDFSYTGVPTAITCRYRFLTEPVPVNFT
jgi:hypothetical protein